MRVSASASVPPRLGASSGFALGASRKLGGQMTSAEFPFDIQFVIFLL
jgi:hypothetical protein